jgi:hypothetical protein
VQNDKHRKEGTLQQSYVNNERRGDDAAPVLPLMEVVTFCAFEQEDSGIDDSRRTTR